jgi:hypothetical protein
MLAMTPSSGRGLRGIYFPASAWYTAFALYAAGVALFCGGLDRVWGDWAVAGYAVAAAVAAWQPTRRGQHAALAVALLGALAGPLIWLAVLAHITSDSLVVENSAIQLLRHGVPYYPPAYLASHGWLAYNPYLPAMAAFGLPKALGLPGLLGDPRPWLAAATFGILVLTFRISGEPAADGRGGPDAGPRVPLVTLAPVTSLPATSACLAGFLLASPVMAFPISLGITDPPIIALMCLALALISQPRNATRAAAVIGLAAAMKYTAWPGLAVIAVMVAARDGMRAAARFAAAGAASCAVLALAFAPAAFGSLPALLKNTLDYPLGLTAARSPAQSPLPGHLLSELGSGGHAVALGLLAAAVLAILASLVRTPPTTPQQAAIRIALGLSALFVFGPDSRFGYCIYPLALCGWAAVTTPRMSGPRGPLMSAPLASAVLASARLARLLGLTGLPRQEDSASGFCALAPPRLPRALRLPPVPECAFGLAIAHPKAHSGSGVNGTICASWHAGPFPEAAPGAGVR